MLRFSSLGLFSLFSSILTLLLQAIVSLTSQEAAWKKLTITDVIEPNYFSWVDHITLLNFNGISNYILNMPLYALFFCLMVLFFVLSGLFEKN